MNTWYFYASTGKSEWKHYLADDRERVLASEHPEFVTVLDINKVWAKNEDRPHDLRYRGDLYFDWDGEGSIQDVLDSVKRFMNKLEDKGFNLNQASWYLSGKKGVHCTIPIACFFEDKSLKSFKQDGFPALPLIYRNFAAHEQLITDHLDQSVYTQGKGRMWRTCNRPRQLADGKTTYKVAILPSALRKLDEQGYWDWVSEPRPAITPDAPSKCPQLAAILHSVMGKVSDMLKERKRNQGNAVDFSNWKTLPPTMQAAFAGQGIDHSKDLNLLKMQICIAAVATQFPKLSDEDRFIEAIDGFIQSRVGLQGASHQTYASIEKEMRNGFRSVAENPCYQYTAQGFASILTGEFRQNPDIAGAQLKSLDVVEKIRLADMQRANNKQVTDIGIIEFNKQDDLGRSISNYSWQKNSKMKMLDRSGNLLGYSVVPLVNGKEAHRTILTIDDMLSAKAMCRHVMSVGGHLEQVDNRAMSQVLQALKSYSSDDDDYTPEVETVITEGLHIQTRYTQDQVDDMILANDIDYDQMFNLYWVEPNRIVASDNNNAINQDGKHLPSPVYLDKANPDGRFKIDLSQAKQTLGTTKASLGDTMHALLEMNGNFFSLSVVLGWLTACLLKHPLYKMDKVKNFPILQVYGEAGCGKTTTVNLLLNLFSWRKELHVNTAGGMTQAGMNMMVTGTTCIPFIIDEVKMQNLDISVMKTIRQMLQNLFTVGGGLVKAGGQGTGSHHNSLVSDPMLAPVAFMGETLETSQTSLMERIVAAQFYRTDKIGREQHAEHLQHNKRAISVLGWTLVNEVMNGSLNQLAKDYAQAAQDTKRVLKGADRIIENATIVLLGFRFLAKVLEKHFPNRFTEKLAAMEHTLLDLKNWVVEVPTEIVRLLNFLSQASHDAEYSNQRAVKGQHYLIEEADSMEGKVENVVLSCDQMYYLYRTRMKAIGEVPVFHSSEEMHHALSGSSITIDALDHPRLGKHCVRLSGLAMKHEGIRPFKNGV